MTLFEKHVPIISRVVTVRRHAPWYTESLRDAKRRRHGHITKNNSRSSTSS